MITQEEADEYIKTIQQHFKPRLTEWEEEFVESIRCQRLVYRILSHKQLETLDKIMDRCATSYGRNDDGDED